MKQLFVPYQLAKLAKETGFNEPCFSKWEKDIDKDSYSLYPILGTLCLSGPYEKESNGYDQKQINEGGYRFTGYKNSVLDHNKSVTAAPLYQQLVDWFRDRYDLIITVTPKYTDEGEKWSYTFMVTKFGKGVWEGGGMKYYHEALTAAIEKAFELI